ncbi:type III secretion system needle length determinant [Vibrio sp. VPAP30]|uniref:type III secretion system needle length determinant n=1 Tax=Vibrio sp. VPAP30 TaxID=1647102 RepID=UPI00065A558F|nr:type III secretion system needle length determinant [Vibrio sp. VPAP30]KLN64722.1 translocation protein in type III secretion [Vibrio sp. VPAP30]
MQIKQNIDSQTQNPPQRARSQKALEQDPNRLQSRFESAMADKKQLSKKKASDKDSEQTNTVESLPADKIKLSSSQGVSLQLAQSNSQRQDSDLSPKDKNHRNPMAGSSGSLATSKGESNLSSLGRGASSAEVKEIPFELLETHSTPKTEATQSHSSNAMTQGELILRSMTSQASQPTQRELSHLVKQLVEQIQVSLPNATTSKEVRLLLNDGQLKGGEIQIKLDNQGYSVTIRQDNALSVINQQARQELSERLNRLNLDQPIKITVTEQTDQQHDQQHSRQQRSIYDEWQPEEN